MRVSISRAAENVGTRASYDRPLRVLYQDGRSPFVLSAPGTYRFKASYQDSFACTPGTETAIINVNVVAPTGSDLIIWNANQRLCELRSSCLHSGVIRSTQADQDGVALLRSLAKQYPKSRYTKLVG